MRSIFDDCPVFDDQDAISAPGGFQPMRHHNAGARVRQGARGLQYCCFGGGVERGGGFVEKQHGAAGQLRPRECNDLALPGGQAAAPLANPRIQTTGNRGDDISRPQRGHRSLNVRTAAYRRPRVPNVGCHRPAKQVALLRHLGDRAAPLPQRKLANIPVPGAHRTGVGS